MVLSPGAKQELNVDLDAKYCAPGTDELPQGECRAVLTFNTDGSLDPYGKKILGEEQYATVVYRIF